MYRQYFKQNISPKSVFHETVSHVFSIIEETVGATFGPYGTHNMFLNGPDIKSSKDGIENLTMMKMDSTIARLVHQMTMNVALDQSNRIGDGTTSAILITARVYKSLMENKQLWEKYTPSQITSAMGGIQNQIIKLAHQSSRALTPEKVKALIHTSTDANEELSKVLYDVYLQEKDLANKNIILDYSRTGESFVDNKKGIEFSGALSNKAFGNQDETTTTLQNAEIIIIDGKAEINGDIINYVNKLKTQNKSLLIICSGVNENFYRYIEAVSQQQPKLLNNFAVCYSRLNTIQDKDTFYDVLKLVDCAYIGDSNITLENIESLHKGYAENVVIKNRRITLGGFNETEEFNSYLKNMLDEITYIENELNSVNVNPNEVTTLQLNLSKLKTRYYKLKDGVTTVYVGGETQLRKHINYRLIEDGLKALQNALKHGYFPGCNTVIPNIIIQMMISQKQMDGTNKSIYYILMELLLDAYMQTFAKLISNKAKLSYDEIMTLVLGDKYDEAYDTNTKLIIPMTGLFIRPIDLRDDGVEIINPAETDINIVEKAIDAALVLATSNTIMTDDMEFEGTTYEN